MSAAGRAFVEERFGVPVISRYGAVEAPRIGLMCEARSGFHLNEDLCHLRLIDADGRDVPDGEVGEVVISNLVNRGTLLLNYRLGDYARFAQGACPCGRTLRRLEGLEGRVAEVLRLGNGFVHQYAIWHALTAIDDLVNFQLVQLKRRRFELRLEPASREGYEPVAASRTVACAASSLGAPWTRSTPSAWSSSGAAASSSGSSRSRSPAAVAEPSPRPEAEAPIAPGSRRWTPGSAARRAVAVARVRRGLRSLWTRALGETVYRRLIARAAARHRTGRSRCPGGARLRLRG